MQIYLTNSTRREDFLNQARRNLLTLDYEVKHHTNKVKLVTDKALLITKQTFFQFTGSTLTLQVSVLLALEIHLKLETPLSLSNLQTLQSHFFHELSLRGSPPFFVFLFID